MATHCIGFSHAMSEKKANTLCILKFLMKPLVFRHVANTIRSVLDQKDSEM